MQLLGQAQQRLQGGQWAAAEALCRQALATQPREAMALHLLGASLLQQGRYAEAEQALAACLQQRPGEPAALGNRGIALQGLGRLEEALACYAQSLAAAPAQPATLNMQALALLQLQRFEQALESFDRALALAPTLAELWCNRANALIPLRRYDDALDSLQRAEALRPDYGEALSNQAFVLNLLGRHEQALRAAQRAAELLPDNPTVTRLLADALAGLKRFGQALPLYNLAINGAPEDAALYRARARVQRELQRPGAEADDLLQALRLLGPGVDLLVEAARALVAADRADEGLDLAEQALKLDAAYADALSVRFAALRHLRRWPQVVAAYEQLAALEPEAIEWRFGYAAALKEAGHAAEAVAAFDDALARQPDNSLAINDRALALADLGRYDEALAGFARATQIDPSSHAPHFHEALLRLMLGQYDVGWSLYEWRWKRPEFVKAGISYRQPRFTGSEDVARKTVFLFGEQGLGDVIQFSRYAPLVAARGARVIVGAHPPLKPLLQTLDGVDQVIGNGEPLPPFDLQCSLLSLPLAFGTRLETIPASVPYLHADPQRVLRWSQRLGPRRGLRIGLAWSGDPRGDPRRRIPAMLLAPLLERGGQFVCLSKFVLDSDAQSMRALGIKHYGAELTDFAETAALVSLMDVVISVDTSIAHLAGALARPLWLLLTDPPSYQWLLVREDSPWYPTARLFRQRSRGDWNEVIDRVAAELPALPSAP
jgi:tetratricopeptide (TPR) repeat protein